MAELEMASEAAAPTFSTIVERLDNEIVISVAGEIDMVTCGDLRDAIEPHLGPRQMIVLDLSAVTFMDSSCLGVLVKANGHLTSDGGSLALRNPSTAARRLLSAANVEHLLDDGVV
jgi:anti-anti-sigma factor